MEPPLLRERKSFKTRPRRINRIMPVPMVSPVRIPKPMILPKVMPSGRRDFLLARRPTAKKSSSSIRGSRSIRRSWMGLIPPRKSFFWMRDGTESNKLRRRSRTGAISMPFILSGKAPKPRCIWARSFSRTIRSPVTMLTCSPGLGRASRLRPTC